MTQKNKNVAIILLGVGKVGKTFYQVVLENQLRLQNYGIKLSVCAVVNSKKIYFNERGVEYNGVDFISNSVYDLDYTNLISLIQTLHDKLIIIVDCTASLAPVNEYKNFIANGYQIVAANKLANILPYNEYSELYKQLIKYETSFRYAVNVGAGLPVISTIQDLVMRGERIIKIESMLSGTLGYIFDKFKSGSNFTSIIDRAKSLGITEPNYLDDLTGIDVARKLLIMARLAGYKYDMQDIDLEPVMMFSQNIEYIDDIMQRKLHIANKKEKILRYTASLINDKCIVGLNECPISSPYNQCHGTDNVVAIYTETYHDKPIIIQGKGAGLRVTAYGLFSDVIKTSLGERFI